MFKKILIILVAFWLLPLGAVQAESPAFDRAAIIGAVKKLTGHAFVTRGTLKAELEVGDAIFKNDIILTGSESSIGIVFSDGSVFSLGEDARMTIDSLVYDSASGEGASEVTVSQGVFKFISGEIAANNPGDMVVDTPVATLGVRGTTGGGKVVGAGGDNQFYLEPNADGTIGSFDIKTDIGTITLNQPYMLAGIADIHTRPPEPEFTTPEVIEQEFAIPGVMPEGAYDGRPGTMQRQTAPAKQDSNRGKGVEQTPAEEAAVEFKP